MVVVTAFLAMPGPDDDGGDYVLYTWRATFVLERALNACGAQMRDATRHATGAVTLDNRVFQTALELPSVAHGAAERMRARGFFGVVIGKRTFPAALDMPVAFRRVYRAIRRAESAAAARGQIK